MTQFEQEHADPDFEDQLRRELRGSYVPFDGARAEEMIAVATSAQLHRIPRAAAPLATAAAVVAVGAGVAIFASGTGGDTAAPAGGPSQQNQPPTPTSTSLRHGALACTGVYRAVRAVDIAPTTPAPALTRYPSAPVPPGSSGIAVVLPPATRAAGRPGKRQVLRVLPTELRPGRRVPLRAIPSNGGPYRSTLCVSEPSATTTLLPTPVLTDTGEISSSYVPPAPPTETGPVTGESTPANAPTTSGPPEATAQPGRPHRR